MAAALAVIGRDVAEDDHVARREPCGTAVVIIGVAVFLGARQDHALDDVRLGVVPVLLQRPVHLFHGEIHVAAAQVASGKLGVDARCLGRLRAGAARGDTTGQQRGSKRQCNDQALVVHLVGTFVMWAAMRAARLLLSSTCPASWPQAASMSSPRVRRVTVTSPLRTRMSRKALMRSSGERLYGVPGNGLNGIRFTLHGRPPSSFASWRACSSLSLTPSSMTYST